MKSARIVTHLSGGAALLCALGVAACDGERTAEAETPISEAEVSTELPETVVSDQRLQAAAGASAAMAASPPAQVVVVPGPPAAAQMQGAQPAAGAQAGTGMQGAGTAGTTAQPGVAQ